MVELCQTVLDGRRMPDEWVLSVVVSIFKGKRDAMSCGAYREVTRACNEDCKKGAREENAPYGESGRDAIWFYARQRNNRYSVHLRRLQEKYVDKEKKLYMCFVDLEKAFDRVPRRVLEFAMRKRGIPEAMVRAVMNLYEGAKTRVRVGLELSEEFEVKVGVHQRSTLSPLLFAFVVDAITESVRNGLMSEMLYADDLVLTSETIERLREKFWKWKGAFESKGLNVNLRKTKVVVSGAEGEVTVSKVDPCGICVMCEM